MAAQHDIGSSFGDRTDAREVRSGAVAHARLTEGFDSHAIIGEWR